MTAIRTVHPDLTSIRSARVQFEVNGSVRAPLQLECNLRACRNTYSKKCTLTGAIGRALLPRPVQGVAWPSVRLLREGSQPVEVPVMYVRLCDINIFTIV